MDYRDSVFMSVAENLSFSKAANDLNISQPAVTRHIKELEERYKTNLLERKGNKVYLTKAGEKVYNYTVPVLMLVVCGIVSIFLAYMLLRVDKQNKYGLELPSGETAV